jgi:hypothetical protein
MMPPNAIPARTALRSPRLFLLALLGCFLTSCSLIVDVGDLSRSDAEAADGRDGDVAADADADAADGDVADTDVDAGDGDGDGDVDATDGDADGDDGADSDAETTDGDADASDADADAGDGDADVPDGDATTVGPPARVWGEMTASGAPAGADGCVATGTDLCMRSDTLDPGSLELSGGDIRLRGIVVGGGRP